MTVVDSAILRAGPIPRGAFLIDKYKLDFFENTFYDKCVFICTKFRTRTVTAVYHVWTAGACGAAWWSFIKRLVDVYFSDGFETLRDVSQGELEFPNCSLLTRLLVHVHNEVPAMSVYTTLQLRSDQPRPI